MLEYHYILVGGGLQSALLALALRAQRPEARLAVVERGARLGGNHTWCFHREDLSPSARKWIRPLVSREWPGYEVRFPGFDRRIDQGYAAIESTRVDPVVREALGDDGEVFVGTSATILERDRVVLDDGRELTAPLVVDARGLGGDAAADAGYQKFFGREFRLRAPHGLEGPVLMDARTDQSDGFRFFYVLPFDDDRLLIEDTRFSASPELDEEDCAGEIEHYAAAQGWQLDEELRRERGLLPMPWNGEPPSAIEGPLVAGYRGGWFHPGTGYSLPVAARLAETVASLDPTGIRSGGLGELRREHHAQSRFCHLLNRMLFRWYPPEMRWHIFARFYRLSPALIARFYALRLRPADRARLLVGRPPRGLSLRYRLNAGVAS